MAVSALGSGSSRLKKTSGALCSMRKRGGSRRRESLGGTLEETAKAFHDFYDARAVNGVVHTTLTEVSAAVGATLASSALEVLVLSASSQWWDIKVRLSDGAVQMRFHRLGRRRGLFGSQEPETA